MKELVDLLGVFFGLNSDIVIKSIVFQVMYSALESIVIPFVLGKAFNDIKDKEQFKTQLVSLVVLWAIVKAIGCCARYYHNSIEPELSKFIMMVILESVFAKFDRDDVSVNIGVLIDKMHMINVNLHDFSHLLFTVFIPRGIVLVISCINFYMINQTLGLTIIGCVALQCFVVTRDVAKCVPIVCEEHEFKKQLYDYIEDVFNNIDTVRSTHNGYSYEIQQFLNLTSEVKNLENNTHGCVNFKQQIGYASNIMIFAFIVYTVYRLYDDGSITPQQTTTVMLLLFGLFDNMCDMAFYMPEFTRKFGILESNNAFLKELMSAINEREDAPSENYNVSDNIVTHSIVFDNVSFKYPKSPHYLLQNFSVAIPPGITCLYGKSGIGKTTFAKLIFGIMKPTEGRIIIDGDDISLVDIQGIRKKIAFVEQNTNVLFDRSIIDNIYYTKEIGDKDVENLKQNFTRFKLYDIFKSLDKDGDKWSFLNKSAGKKGNNLSGGQRKLVHLLRLCSSDDASFIILDEPSTGLDSTTKSSLIDIILYLKTQGKTILIITHDDDLKGIPDNILEFYQNSNPVLTINH